MKYLLLSFIPLWSVTNLLSQEKMIVNQKFNGNTYYGEFSKPVRTLDELSSVINFNLDGYLTKIMGSINDSLSFSHGQIIDLETKFESDSVTFKRGWIVPKYDLNFVLKDNSLGITKYYLQIHMDQYGQVLFCNWPRKGYSDRKNFKEPSEIIKLPQKRATIKGYDFESCIIEFRYNQRHDELCWVFRFPTNGNHKTYDTIEIPWVRTEIIESYTTTISTSE